jgi:hypothetical protein
VPIIPTRTSLPDLPHTSPPSAVFKIAGREGERGEQSNYNDDDSGGYVGGNGNDDDGNSDDGNGDDGNAAAKKKTTTYGDGDDVYDGDGRRRRWRR